MTVIDYLEQSAARCPDKTAFADRDRSITYGELLETVRRIASGLIGRGTGENQPVAVLVDRNVESIISFLGVAMSRNFYVPVDASQPVQRVQTIFGQMEPAAVIAAAPVPEELEGLIRMPLYSFEELSREEIRREELQAVRQRCMNTDPLFAICTSGSTGVPKGVVKAHLSVLSFIPVFAQTFGFTEDEVFGNQSPFDFDVSAKDIYSTLYLGASMYIIPKVCFTMPKLLISTMEEQRITTIVWAVSALCIVAGVNAFKKKIPPYLKKVLFSGEVMPVKMLNIWRSWYPEALFVNLYGPTESTGNCLYYVIDREFGLTEKLPLGKPFANEDVLFLNEQNRPIQPGETGEICILGSCLALGYYRNPEKTAASFVQNPLNDRYPERMYRTGDIAELSSDGQYYFAARKDFQIKHMGHRIELEEIETYLNAADGVVRASCLFDTDKNKIVCCYMGEADQVSIINQLKKDLPKYMIPNIFIQLEALPVNKNGKIDRQGIRELYTNRG